MARFSRVAYLLRRTWSTIRHEGLGTTLTVVRDYIRRGKLTNPGFGVRDLFPWISAVDLTAPKPECDPAIRKKPLPKKLHINWVVPDFGMGSGGHMMIARTIRALEASGHKNTLYIFGPVRHPNPKAARAFIQKYFYNIQAEVVIGVENIQPSDALIATAWQTAYPVFCAKNTRKKFYFMQDFEPYFYAQSSDAVCAENTYRFGFYGITGGPWLEKMAKQYGMPAEHFDFGYDPEWYHPMPEIQRQPKTIAFYARPVTPRRAFDVGVLAFEKVLAQHPDVKLVFYGGETRAWRVPFQYENRGILGQTEMAQLYAESTLGVCFSATNASLVPYEMMACGLPVIDLKGDNTETFFGKGKHIVLAEPTPHAIAGEINRLLDDATEQTQISTAALAYIKNRTWEKSLAKIEGVLLRELKAAR